MYYSMYYMYYTVLRTVLYCEMPGWITDITTGIMQCTCTVPEYGTVVT